ncbi:MAG: hypothetical protein MJ189_01235 [Coriobacteriales bacterium]|nr:hypothetical protein [Coriobacteriales bacterium]
MGYKISACHNFVKRALFKSKGQASLEYLLVGIVLMLVTCALGALVHFIADGGLGQLIQTFGSHDINSLEGFVDAFLY